MTKQGKKNQKVKLKDVLEVTLWFGLAVIAIVIGIACLSGGGEEEKVAAQIPAKITGFVYDPEHQLADTTVDKVNTRLRTLMHKTTAEVVVAVVSATGNLTIEDWSQQTFESLGIGKKDLDNGLLLVIATDQHKARIHTGYGVEGVLPDATCSRILHSLVNPQMAAEKFDVAVDSATLVIDSILTNPANTAEIMSEYTSVPSAASSLDRQNRKVAHKDEDVAAGYWTLGVILLLILLIVIVPKIYTPRRERFKKGPKPPAKRIKYLKCPECGRQKYHLTFDVVTKAPRYKQEGKGVRRYSCDACGHSAQENYTIGRLKKWSLDGILSFIVFAAKMKSTGGNDADTDDDNYSGGGSSSSSGGDFSGGSSGGGGTSSEW